MLVGWLFWVGVFRGEEDDGSCGWDTERVSGMILGAKRSALIVC